MFNEHTQLHIYKALLQLAFPTYVILLVITAIVASECSSKFARIIGKGNPVAVLATMILLSYSKFSNAVLASFSLLHGKPALGSRIIDVTKLGNVLNSVSEINNKQFKAITFFLLAIVILVLLLCIIYATLIFSWQWLL